MLKLCGDGPSRLRYTHVHTLAVANNVNVHMDQSPGCSEASDTTSKLCSSVLVMLVCTNTHSVKNRCTQDATEGLSCLVMTCMHGQVPIETITLSAVTRCLDRLYMKSWLSRPAH